MRSAPFNRQALLPVSPPTKKSRMLFSGERLFRRRQVPCLLRRTARWRKPVSRVIEASLNSDLKKSSGDSPRSIIANRNVAPTVEGLESATPRAAPIVKENGIPPPDWGQLMAQEDYLPRRGHGVTIDPELHRLIWIQEEDGVGPEGVFGPNGEIIVVAARLQAVPLTGWSGYGDTAE